MVEYPYTERTVKPNLNKSWRTTTIGFLGGVDILINELVAVLDTNPETNMSLEAIGVAFAAMGIGYFARDRGVSSEQEKA